MTTCPESIDNLTKIGYYGSFLTLNCYPCPSPCSNCNIDIIKNRYPDISCGSDKFCAVGLVCTSCLQGYVVVGGKCITQNSCREYAYFSPPTIGTSWSASYCYCLDGYSSATYAKCDLRCDLSCKTCTGITNTDCASCYSGYYLNAGSCDLNATASLGTFKWAVSDGLAIT